MEYTGRMSVNVDTKLQLHIMATFGRVTELNVPKF